jgi:serine protease
MGQTSPKHRVFLKLCVAAILLDTCAAISADKFGKHVPVAAKAYVNYANRVTRYVNHIDRLIVKYKDVSPYSKNSSGLSPEAPIITGERLARIQNIAQQLGLSISAQRTIATGAHVLKLSKRLRVDEVRALARLIQDQDRDVEYAEPDRLMQALFTPNDSLYREQWNYYDSTAGIGLPAAWDKSTGAGVTVAVLDTGYRPHAELAGQILPGYDFISDMDIANDGDGRDNDASDPGDAISAGECGFNEPEQFELASWHGTHVAGTIAASSNNSMGVAGVAFNAKILPARVLGKCGGYTSDIADAIIWASGGEVNDVPVNHKAQVINISLGTSGGCDRTTQAAIDSARSRGTVIVVAAGNESRDVSNSNPANCQGVIAVTAIDRSGSRAWYSNFGSLVSIAAPGGEISTSTSGGILSTLNAGSIAPGADSYESYQGTSMAAPHVAGVVALMLSKNPSLSPDDVAGKLMSTARPFPESCLGCGAGIVDASAAVDAAALSTSPLSGTAPNIPLPSANSRRIVRFKHTSTGRSS